MNYEAYTLGQTTGPEASRRKAAASLSGVSGNNNPTTAIDRLNHDHAMSYGLQPAARYLVQRWSDGTRCDKTGRPREVEVQIHCSMTSNDMIYMIKELAICQYVMVVHSPHLCSLPGFKVEHTEIKPAAIRCREVIGDEDFAKWSEGPKFELPPRRIEPPLQQQQLQEIQKGQQEKAKGDSGLTASLEKAIGGLKVDEEMLVLSWEEGDDGPVMIESDTTGKTDKEMLFKLLREYLNQKVPKEREEDEGENRHDEL
jgi:protein OS-9